MSKCIFAQFGHTSGNGHRRQLSTAVKCISADEFQFTAEIDLGQTVAVVKGIVSNLLHGVCHYHRSQFAVVIKGIRTNGSDIFLNAHRGDGRGVRIPGRVGSAVIKHISTTGDDQRSVILQYPNSAFTAAAHIQPAAAFHATGRANTVRVGMGSLCNQREIRSNGIIRFKQFGSVVIGRAFRQFGHLHGVTVVGIADRVNFTHDGYPINAIVLGERLRLGVHAYLQTKVIPQTIGHRSNIIDITARLRGTLP